MPVTINAIVGAEDIIDAMDLLYTANFDGFCIVSSDSDFTRLASRIREEGLFVYGLGAEPGSFLSGIGPSVLRQPFNDAGSRSSC